MSKKFKVVISLLIDGDTERDVERSVRMTFGVSPTSITPSKSKKPVVFTAIGGQLGSIVSEDEERYYNG